MRVYHDFFLVPGSRSTFPEADPDPAQWYGFDSKRATQNPEISLGAVIKSVDLRKSALFVQVSQDDQIHKLIFHSKPKKNQ